MLYSSISRLLVLAVQLIALQIPVALVFAQESQKLQWSELPDLPNELGVAGPFVGTHANALIVAGGANFPKPVWETDKRWHSDIYVMTKREDGYSWSEAGQLSKPTGYGANVSTPDGIVCIGGNNETETFASCFRLQWDSAQGLVTQEEVPKLPHPLAFGQACVIENVVYLAGGQLDSRLSSAVNYMLTLDLQAEQPEWIRHDDWPGPPRAFNMTIAQNNGFRDCVYVIGGRYQDGSEVHFLDDCWEFDPTTNSWRELEKLPQPITAGVGISYGQSHILVLGGDDGALFSQSDELRDAHPGFPRRTFGYNTITDRWTSLGGSPSNQVTTTAVEFDGKIVVPTGEVRPRVRSPQVWSIQARPSQGMFGILDYLVLFLYLASLILIGLYFLLKTRNTDDYFRASGNIPWWAAGCSIFATMLSSLTFTGVPSKAFAQDWVYSIGNFMIPVVAILAVRVALPFYRRIDATSAYEYLESRFHWSIRIFGSLCFSTFHLFRMAIVMSLTGLALAVATPLTPVQSVLLMGGLSILYCAMGGISAVIWTDTLQTFVLLGGAVLAIIWMLLGTGDSLGDSLHTALTADKLRLANWHWSPFDTQVAFWAIVLGAIGQNTSSYTADQAVVQRYMTTPSESLAARAIWTNALLSIPATLLFFGIGTCLFLYYRAHPERLDISITTDQIFPLFISRELPPGLSGLIVAAVFAAAQSTVSTSMNSVATTLLTDCMRPLGKTITEVTWLRLAQGLTVILGIAGTWIAVSFVDPDIRSLFDQFLKIIGLFMGVLGGLFILGTVFRRANAGGAWIGALSGAGTMFYIWKYTAISAYLYTFVGILTCAIVGLLGSLLFPSPKNVESLCIRFRQGHA